MFNKVRIIKSEWSEVPAGMLAYISNNDNIDNIYSIMCITGVTIILQGYP